MYVFVPGIPQPQGSIRVFMVGGKPRLTSDNERMKPWRHKITNAVWEALREAPEPLDGPCSVILRFILPRPKRCQRLLPTVRPDIDKLARAVLDALTVAEVYTDDSRVVHLSAEKLYTEDDAADGPLAEPGVHIIVTALEGSAP